MATAYTIYKYNDGIKAWESTPCGKDPTTTLLTNVHVLSWNLSSHLPFPCDRVNAVMAHLNSMQYAPHIIFFQDLHIDAINNILSHSLAKSSYYITNPTGMPWGGKRSGNFALVHHCMPEPANHFRVKLPDTGHGADGLFIDFKKRDGKVLRIGTTQIECGDASSDSRKKQLAHLLEYLPPKCTDNATSGILIGEVYESTPLPDGIRDAYKDMGGTDGGEEGYTWGMNCWPRVVGQRRQRVLGGGNVSWSNLIRIGGEVKASGSPVSEGVGLMVQAAF